MEMEQLVAAFAAMSGRNNNPPPAAQPVQMEELVAAFAASLSMSGHDSIAAPPPAAHPGAAVPNQWCHKQETTSAEGPEDDDVEPAKGEETCVLRVRFPDGRVICKRFGPGRPTAALYQYCRSVLLAGGAAARGRTFRVMRLAGGASDEMSCEQHQGGDSEVIETSTADKAASPARLRSEIFVAGRKLGFKLHGEQIPASSCARFC